MKNLKTDFNKILLIGIGNCGRGDDGLGWKFTDLLSEKNYNWIDLEYRYQLQIEDTELINNYDTVIFVDASHTTLKDGFEIRPCTAANHYFFSSHMQSPETILYLANDLFKKFPEAYIIAISGNEWELKTALSEAAEKNLHAAFNYFNTAFIPFIRPLLPVRNDTYPVQSVDQHIRGNCSPVR